MNVFTRSALAAALTTTLTFGLVACNKNKDVETDPMPTTGTVTLNGRAEVPNAAFHPNRVGVIIDEHQAELASCFEGQGDMQVKVNVMVEPSGAVQSVKATSGKPSLDACLSSAFKTMTFPSFDGKAPIKVVAAVQHSL